MLQAQGGHVASLNPHEAHDDLVFTLICLYILTVEPIRFVINVGLG